MCQGSYLSTCSSAEEQWPSKPLVVGSIPTRCSPLVMERKKKNIQALAPSGAFVLSKGVTMKLPEAVTKYYDLRYTKHITYVSPVEHRKDLLKKEDNLLLRSVDTVSISKEGKLLLRNSKWLPTET